MEANPLSHFVAQHFWRLYFLSIVLLIAASFHAAFEILPQPRTSRGIIDHNIAAITYTHRNRVGTSQITLYKPVMIFSYEGRMYQALGTAGEARRQDSITVIFNATTPTEAKEFTLPGLLDFPLANHCFQLWLLLSAGLYGLASADDTFVMGNFTVRKLKLPYFLLLVVLLVSMPLLAYTDLWLFGREVTGTVQSDTVQRYGTEMRLVSYQVGKAHYMTHFDHTRYLEADPGTEVEVRYLPFHPQRAAVMQLSDMYSSAYLSIMGILLLFIAGWFYASRSILEDGTTA